MVNEYFLPRKNENKAALLVATGDVTTTAAKAETMARAAFMLYL